MDRILIKEIKSFYFNKNTDWKKSQLSKLWGVNEQDLDKIVEKNFDNEQIKILYNDDLEQYKKCRESMVFSDSETVFTVWRKTSERPFYEWAKINGLDLFSRVMSGREFVDEPRDYIEHYLYSDYVTSQLVRGFPASLKQILQWNHVERFDDLLSKPTIRLYIKNIPEESDWPMCLQPVRSDLTGKQLYCDAPFGELVLTNDASHFCCSAWHGFPSLGDPKTQSLDTIWSGKNAVEFRNSILDGSYRYCRHDICPKIVNKETSLKDKDSLSIEIKEDIGRDTSEFSSKFTFVNYGFDVSCNLSCPSCRTEVIIAKGKAAEEIKFIESQLEQNGKDLRQIYVSGSGDAFGSPYSRDFLSRMSEENFPRLESILLHTNGQLFNEFTWNKLPHFVQQRISYVEISVDAARKDTYEENRRGGKFERLLENLIFIQQLKNSGQHLYVKLSFVVQKNNYKQMVEFVEMAKFYSADCIFFCRLMNWGAFSDKEYQERDVTNRKHPEFNSLTHILKSEVFKDEIVDLTNIGGLLK